MVPSPISISLLLQEIEHPLRSTLSFIIILADDENVLSLVGAYIDDAVERLDEDTSKQLLPIMISLCGALIIITLPKHLELYPKLTPHIKHLNLKKTVLKLPIIPSKVIF